VHGPGESTIAFGRSGTFYAATIGAPSSRVFASTDNGATFPFRANAYTCPSTGPNQCGFTFGPPANTPFPDQEHIAADRFNALGVEVDALGRGRRPLTRSCLDWSERRPHLAGELGAAMLTALLDRGWLVRRPAGRAVAVTPRGAAGLDDVLAIDVAALAPAAIDRTPLRRVA